MPVQGKTPVHRFRNCRLLRDHQLLESEDLWIRNGQIECPGQIFFGERATGDVITDCNNLIIAPGFIDPQINGAFGSDFSSPSKTVSEDIRRVAKGILAHGVTSFCPTIVTIRHELYKEVLPHFVPHNGNRDGAGVLGLHLEGPFISKDKRGAHLLESITDMKNGISDVLSVYNSLDNVAMVTIAPEIPGALEVIADLHRKGIVVALGHSAATLAVAEAAVANGAKCITHLFNAMNPFHHRDPHIMGLLASDQIPSDMTMFYGLIADGIHTHPTALRIAHRLYPKGAVLVTDATAPMGLPPGIYPLGCQTVEVKNNRAVIAGTDLLCGRSIGFMSPGDEMSEVVPVAFLTDNCSIATLDQCVRYFLRSTGCSVVEALEAATLHPAQLLGITSNKGTLDFGTDADFILLDDDLNVRATYIAGEQVWKDPSTVLDVQHVARNT